MNIFIVFVKFLDWIVTIWVRLARLIREKGHKNKNEIENYYKKKNGPKGAWAPLGSIPDIYIYTYIHTYIHIYIYIYEHFTYILYLSNNFNLPHDMFLLGGVI